MSLAIPLSACEAMTQATTSQGCGAKASIDSAKLSTAGPDIDREHLTRIAHDLKSSSAVLGIRDFAELCKQAELAARAGDVRLALGLAPRIVADFAEVEKVVGAVLAGISGNPADPAA